uniref:Alpha/beta hydrolase domain-containing protein n=1 Tax=Vannella robusta TaxID=1487602 RepID=A0A7S4ID20_9EUKA|mmetsp:Transcript_24012/g.30551  ORF Transcript_24012/g.30551 Transcript_24012/m.30551 type:complete len:634 (+) Transcript_24012:55-1956(+)
MSWRVESVRDFGEWRETRGTLTVVVNDFTRVAGLTEPRECTMDVVLVAPKNCENSTVVFDVVNRGIPLMWNICEQIPPTPGKGFEQGNKFFERENLVYVACGWQSDLISRPGCLRLETEPFASKSKILCEMDTSTQHMQLHPDKPVDRRNLRLSSAGHIPLLATEGCEAELYKLEHPRDQGEKIERSQWNFGKYEAPESDLIVKDQSCICMKNGFEKGTLYQLVYETSSTSITGLGLSCISACATWLKSGDNCPIKTANIIAVGGSQTGRLLRTFIRDGFNLDPETNSDIFDGFFICVAGASQGQFNQVNGQASMSMPHLATCRFPFASSYSEDPVTQDSGSLHAKLESSGSTAKMIYYNTSIEYHRGDASLFHVDVTGEQDLPIAKNTRYYVLGGAPHNPFPSWPPSRADSPVPIGNIQQTLINSVEMKPFFRAMIHNLNLWITKNMEPPDSCYPTLQKGSLVTAAEVYQFFAQIPGISVPKEEFFPKVWRRDYGYDQTTGICTKLPPVDGNDYAGSFLVPQIDYTGNELDTVQMPIVAVPLASFTGWALRHPDFGGQERLMMVSGSTIPLSTDSNSSDPRPTIETLYSGKENYLASVEKHANKLVNQNFLLEEDLPLCISVAELFWDWMNA